MKRKFNKDELIDFFQKGLVSDLMYAIHHYFIWRTVGENSDELKLIGKGNIENLFGTLQSSSHTLAVLSLAKIFDSPSKKYQTNSIYSLLSIEVSEEHFFPMDKFDFDYLNTLSDLLNGSIIVPDIIHSYSELNILMFDILSIPLVKNKIDNVKYIRDKFLAHNEYDADFAHLKKFWEDFDFLILLLKIFTYLLGLAFSGTHYPSFQNCLPQTIHFTVILNNSWLISELESYIGIGKFKYWWRN